MEQLPTAEELAGHMYAEGSYEELIDPIKFAVSVAKEFAKLHVEQALKEASEKAKLNVFTKGDYKGAKWIVLKDGDTYNPMERSSMVKINKKSILNSYPLENIK